MFMASETLKKKIKVKKEKKWAQVNQNSRHPAKVRKPPWQCLKRF